MQSCQLHAIITLCTSARDKVIGIAVLVVVVHRKCTTGLVSVHVHIHVHAIGLTDVGRTTVGGIKTVTFPFHSVKAECVPCHSPLHFRFMCASDQLTRWACLTDVLASLFAVN